MRARTVFLILFMCFAACAATRKQILAEIWLNNKMSPSLCNPDQALLAIGLETGFYKMVNGKPQFQYGFYRRLNDGKIEFLSYCTEAGGKMVSMDVEKFNQFLDELLPKKKP